MRPRPKHVHARAAPRPRWRAGSLASLSALVALYVATALRWEMPWWLGPVYAAMSTVCYLSYAADKAAARQRQRRRPEITLLALGLACGWPGAVLAQEILRHKSVKPAFRRLFWLTVLLNLGAFLLLFTPAIEPWSPLYHP